MAQHTTALVTLQGKNSGMQGIRVVYPDNKPTPKATQRYKYHSFVVRILGENAYMSQCSLVGVPYGIEIKNTKNVVITEVSGCYYDVGVRIVDSENIYIDEMLENAAVVCRFGYAQVMALTKYFLLGWPTDVDGMSDMYRYITRANTAFFQAQNSKNISIVNCSAFGIRTFYEAENSEAKILACNSDNCSDYIWRVDGGTLNVVNMFKYNDRATYMTWNDGVVNCFNTLTLHLNATKDYELDTDDVGGKAYASVSVNVSGELVDDLPVRYYK